MRAVVLDEVPGSTLLCRCLPFRCYTEVGQEGSEGGVRDADTVDEYMGAQELDASCIVLKNKSPHVIDRFLETATLSKITFKKSLPQVNLYKEE